MRCLRFRSNGWRAALLVVLGAVAFQGTRRATKLMDGSIHTVVKPSPGLPPYDVAKADPSLHSLNYRIDPNRLRHATENFTLWEGLQSYQRLPSSSADDEALPAYYNDVILSPQAICVDGPGEGLEDEGGYKLLTEKVRLHTSPPSSQRLLCVVYTYPLMHPLARTVALTWGRHCDGFVAFSTETFPDLGFLDLKHEGPEAYANMWQKVRSLWTYIHQHYRDDYDLFHLSGDDTYVLAENLKLRYDTLVDRQNWTDQPIFLGQWVPHGPNDKFVSGGPGYTLNRLALQALVEQGLPTCFQHTTASYEDRLTTKCLQMIGIQASDSRDYMTGEQSYHDVSPHAVYIAKPATPQTHKRASFHAKAAAYWQGLPHPQYPNRTMGPQRGLKAAAALSVSFHQIHHPAYMVRIHVIVHRDLCPSSSVLGHVLQAYTMT
jgi:glycoprotein-N-acetylgalactosamine 3-beta-galactosyltransferase